MKRQQLGPTARDSDITESAIFANCVKIQSHRQQQRSEDLSSFLFLSGTGNCIETVFITNPNHSPTCIGVQWYLFSLHSQPQDFRSCCWMELPAKTESRSSWLARTSSRYTKLTCSIDFLSPNQRTISQVKQKHAVLNPNGRTEKVIYLGVSLNNHEKPRCFWWSRYLSTRWSPDKVTWDKERTSSRLNVGLKRNTLTWQKSITKSEAAEGGRPKFGGMSQAPFKALRINCCYYHYSRNWISPPG